jgi:hypothetical protein
LFDVDIDFLLFGRSQTSRSLPDLLRCFTGQADRLLSSLETSGADRLRESAPVFLGDPSRTGRWQTVPGQRAAWPGARPAADPVRGRWSAHLYRRAA